MKRLATTALALIAVFLRASGRVSSGKRSVVSSPVRLPPFGRKARSESFRSWVRSALEQRCQA
eukprot:673120-Pyramimonas_sp.AAC.1